MPGGALSSQAQSGCTGGASEDLVSTAEQPSQCDSASLHCFGCTAVQTNCTSLSLVLVSIWDQLAVTSIGSWVMTGVSQEGPYLFSLSQSDSDGLQEKFTALHTHLQAAQGSCSNSLLQIVRLMQASLNLQGVLL